MSCCYVPFLCCNYIYFIVKAYGEPSSPAVDHAHPRPPLRLPHSQERHSPPPPSSPPYFPQVGSTHTHNSFHYLLSFLCLSPISLPLLPIIRSLWLPHIKYLPSWSSSFFHYFSSVPLPPVLILLPCSSYISSSGSSPSFILVPIVCSFSSSSSLTLFLNSSPYLTHLFFTILLFP